MIRNILEYLERASEKYSEKTAFIDEGKSITFGQLKERAKKIASAMLEQNGSVRPIPVYMQKSADEIVAFMSIVYTGCSYVPIDPQMPEKRVEKVLSTIEADMIITDAEGKNALTLLNINIPSFSVEELEAHEINEKILAERRREAIDTDLLYIIFTSGSTGDPKGVAISHRAVIDFTEWFSTAAHFDSSSVFGNQAPFYFDMSVKDIYSTLRNGATTYIIPKHLFNFPVDLFHFIEEHGINTLAWATSAVCLVTKDGAFEKAALKNVRTICFGGEAMPVKLLKIWQKYLPNAMYMNMYGPTETAVDCTYHIIDIKREYETGYYPAGRPCENTGILILKGDRLAKRGETGEICVRGTSLAFGYYNDPERTTRAFTQNPLQKAYPELIYHTGDMGYYNEDGEIVFASRKDDQIKHMGYRIELGEIETALNKVQGLIRCCCVFDKEKDRIVCIYMGSASKKEIILEISKFIPKYMWPNVFVKLDEMPMTPNGKIDRMRLKAEYAHG